MQMSRKRKKLSRDRDLNASSASLNVLGNPRNLLYVIVYTQYISPRSVAQRSTRLLRTEETEAFLSWWRILRSTKNARPTAKSPFIWANATSSIICRAPSRLTG